VSWSYPQEFPRRRPAPRERPLESLGGLGNVLAYLANLPLLGTILALIGLLVAGGVVVAAVVFYVLLGPVPIPKVLPAATARTTWVYGADGTAIASWHGAINRQPVALDKISDLLPKAVVAEEDARFYANPGVDARSVLRAAMADFQAGKIVEGGSTITQQYVKVAYVGNKPSLGRKILEARIALDISRHLSKDEIMSRYLNVVYFGDGAYGAQAAAQAYFGEDASALSISQAAMLAGIIHSPDHDSPITNPSAAEADRLRVIRRMEALGSITHAQADQARADKPSLAQPVPANPHYAWFLDALRTQMIQRYGTTKVYQGGLQIHTTLDPSMQAAAEASVAGALPDPSDPYAALVAIDPATGYVRAIVGGRGYGGEQFNIATMGRRQPGSAFKPFVLAAALEQGVSPQTVFPGPARLCPKGWSPGCVTNFGGESFGALSLTDATVNSVNTVYAQLILQVGPQAVADVAHKMGIPAGDVVPAETNCHPAGSDVCRTYLPAVPSLALGSASVTPIEMASAYATLAAGGVYRAPKLATSVVDGSGAVLDDGPSDPVQAIPSSVADTETGILQQVIQRGTGKAAAIGQPAAGKTGTAQDFANAWFVGYTPSLATAVWVGYRDSNQPLLNVHGVKQMTGGTIPAQIWSRYMQVALDTSPPAVGVSGGLPDRAVVNKPVPSFAGDAADDDGNVTSVEVSVDGGPYSGAGITCKGCPGRTVTWGYHSPVSLPDGTHTFAFRAVDVGGHDAAPMTRTVTIDTLPPVATVIQVGGGQAAITANFSEPLSCSTITPGSFSVIEGGRYGNVTAVSCPGTASASVGLTLAFPPRGGDQVAVTVRASSAGPTDLAGNRVAGPPRLTSVASNVAPQAALTGGTPEGQLTANARPPYQGTAADPDGNVTSIEVSVDGAPFSSAGVSCQGCYLGAPLGAPVTWSWQPPARLPDGHHTIAVVAVDNATAASPPSGRSVTIDTVPPTPAGVQAQGGASEFGVSFSKPLACSTLQPRHFTVVAGGRSLPVTAVACDGATSPAVTLTMAVAPRGGDQVAVSVASVTGGPTDLAGNPIGSPATASAPATNTAPSIAVTAGGAGAGGGGITSNPFPGVKGSATDPDGNVVHVQASVDGASFTGNGVVSCQGCFNGAAAGTTDGWAWQAPLRLADGPHTISFQATDNAGALSAPVTTTLTVDTVAPKPTGLQVASGSPSVTETFSKPLVCSSLDPASASATVGGRRTAVTSVACSGNAAATVGLTLDTPVRGGEAVALTLGSTVTDAAGNYLNDRILTASAPNSAPTLSLSPGAASGSGPLATSDPRLVLDGTATDPDGSVASVQASLDGGPFSSGGADCAGCTGPGAAGVVAAPVSWIYHAPTLADGSHTLVLRSVDNAGSASDGVTRTVVVDTRPPAFSAALAAAGSNVVSTAFSKPVACSSVTTGNFTVRVDGTPATLVAATCFGAANPVVDLVISQAPAAGQAVTVSLDQPVTDDSGHRSAAAVVLTSPPGLSTADLP